MCGGKRGREKESEVTTHANAQDHFMGAFFRIPFRFEDLKPNPNLVSLTASCCAVRRRKVVGADW